MDRKPIELPGKSLNDLVLSDDDKVEDLNKLLEEFIAEAEKYPVVYDGVLEGWLSLYRSTGGNAVVGNVIVDLIKKYLWKGVMSLVDPWEILRIIMEQTTIDDMVYDLLAAQVKTTLPGESIEPILGEIMCQVGTRLKGE